MLAPARRRRSAFTLLEVVTTLLVVLILVVLSLPIYSQILRRTERTRCLTNLRSLHVAMDLYLQDHRSWPQIADSDEPATVALAWIDTLRPYGATPAIWVCPTQQKNAGSPDLNDRANARIDYTAMPFDRNPQTPTRWPHYPWFIEQADVHGNGQLIGYADGSVGEVGDYKDQFRKGGAGQ